MAPLDARQNRIGGSELTEPCQVTVDPKHTLREHSGLPTSQSFGSPAILGSFRFSHPPPLEGSEDPWLCGTGFPRLCRFSDYNGSYDRLI